MTRLMRAAGGSTVLDPDSDPDSASSEAERREERDEEEEERGERRGSTKPREGEEAKVTTSTGCILMRKRLDCD